MRRRRRQQLRPLVPLAPMEQIHPSTLPPEEEKKEEEPHSPKIANDEETPHVLLWHGSSPRGHSSSSGSSASGPSEPRIFRRRHHQNIHSQTDWHPIDSQDNSAPQKHDSFYPHNDYNTTEYYDSEGELQDDKDTMELLTPHTHAWWNMDYWRERWTQNDCCLPKQERPYYYEARMRWQQQQQQQQQMMQYQYQQQYQQQYYMYQQQQQQAQYLLSQPMISPLTDASISPMVWNHPASGISPSASAASPMPGFHPYDTSVARASPLPTESKAQPGHYRRVSESPQPPEEEDCDDLLSVSSLESQASCWNTPLLQHHKTQMATATPSEHGDTDGDISTMAGSFSGSSHQPSKGPPQPPRRRTSAGNNNNNKPPVAPPRRQSGPPPTAAIANSTKQHKTQVTQSTIASSSLPPLPASPSFGSSIQTPMSRNPSLQRSYSVQSEASGATTGSRHRRGGTVSEFSFDSDSDDLSLLDSLGPAVEIVGSSVGDRPTSLVLPRPKVSSLRCSSLPAEVQIRVHQVYPMTHQELQPSRHQRVSSLEAFDKVQDSSKPYVSWDCTPPRKWQPPAEESTPEGYVSPLEEELLHTRSRNTVSSSREHTSPSAVTPTSSTSPSSQRNHSTSTRSSNPQDDNTDNDNSIVEEKFTGQDQLVRRSLEGPPSIPKGEGWMWQWLNQAIDRSSSDVPEDVSILRDTPVRSRLPSAGSVKYLDASTIASVASQEVVYFPKSAHMEQIWKSDQLGSPVGSISLSGWVAFGLGETLQQKLASGTGILERKDIGYIVAASKSDKLWVSTGRTCKFDKELDLKDCRAQVQDVSQRHGRAIVVSSVSTGETIFTMLPVCLPENYSSDAPSEQFDGSLCFPRGSYLPDDQQYTTMHIMFTVDALIKANQSLHFLSN